MISGPTVIYFYLKGDAAINKTFVFLITFVLLLTLPAISQAAEKAADIQKTTWQDFLSDIFGHYPLPTIAPTDESAGKITKLDIPKNWEFNVETKRYVASHTSYEFGTEDIRPLSRLQFPVNTWWMNFDVRRTCPRWSIGGRAGFSVNRNSNNWMLDSDWESPGTDHVLTDYAKLYCDVRNAFLFRGDVDINISDWLGLPPELEIRPLFAFQFQRYSLMAHDGEADNVPVLGDIISFRQDWYTYMIGLRGSYNIKMSKNMIVKIKGEADWGPALGYFEDHHIQRGDFTVYQNTMGNALYFLTGLDMTVSKTITMGIGIDYLWIRAYGTEREWNPAPTDKTSPFDASFTDDVKSWTDQLGLTVHVSYAF